MRCLGLVVTGSGISSGAAVCTACKSRNVSTSPTSHTFNQHNTATPHPTQLERNLVAHRQGLAPTHSPLSSSLVEGPLSRPVHHRRHPQESSWETAFELFALWIKSQKEAHEISNIGKSFKNKNVNSGTELHMDPGATRYLNSVLRIATEEGVPGRTLKAAEVVMGGLHGVLNPRSSIGGRSLMGGGVRTVVIQPNSDTYEALLRASGKVGAWRTALRLFENYKEEVIFEATTTPTTDNIAATMEEVSLYDDDDAVSRSKRTTYQPRGISPYAILLALRALSEASSSTSSSSPIQPSSTVSGSHPWELALRLFHQYRHRLMSMSSASYPSPRGESSAGLLPVYWESQRLLLSALRNAGRAQDIVSHFEREHPRDVHTYSGGTPTTLPSVHSCTDVVRMYAIGAYHAGRWDVAVTLASGAFEKTMFESGSLMEKERIRRMQRRSNRGPSSGYCSSVLEGPRGMLGVVELPQPQPPVGVKSTSTFESTASLISCAIMTLHHLAGASSLTTSSSPAFQRKHGSKIDGSLIATTSQHGNLDLGNALLSEHHMHIRRIVSLYSSVVRSEVRAIVALNPPTTTAPTATMNTTAANHSSFSNNLFVSLPSSSDVENSLLYDGNSTPLSLPLLQPSNASHQPYYVSDFAAALSEDALSAVAVAAVKVGVFAVASHAYNHQLLRRQLQSGSANPWLRGVPHTIPGQLLNAQLLALDSRGCHDEVAFLVQSVVQGTTSFPDSDQVLLQLQRLLAALRGAEFKDSDKERLLRSTIERFHGHLNSLEFALVGQCIASISDPGIRGTASLVLLNRLRSQASDATRQHRILSSTLSITRELLIKTTISTRPLPYLLQVLYYLKVEASLVCEQLRGISTKSAQEHLDRVSRGIEDLLHEYSQQPQANNLLGISYIRDQFVHESELFHNCNSTTESRIYTLIQLFMSSSSEALNEAVSKGLFEMGSDISTITAQLFILCLSYNPHHLLAALVTCKNKSMVSYTTDAISQFCKAALVSAKDEDHYFDDDGVAVRSEEQNSTWEMIKSGIYRSQMYRYPSFFHGCFGTMLPVPMSRSCPSSVRCYNLCAFELECSWMMTRWYHTTLVMGEPYQFARFWETWGVAHFPPLMLQATTHPIGSDDTSANEHNAEDTTRLFNALVYSANLCVVDLTTTHSQQLQPSVLRIRFIVDTIQYLLPTFHFGNGTGTSGIERLLSTLGGIVSSLIGTATTALDGLQEAMRGMSEAELMDISLGIPSLRQEHKASSPPPPASSSTAAVSGSPAHSLLHTLHNMSGALEGILNVLAGLITCNSNTYILNEESGNVVGEVCKLIEVFGSKRPIHTIREFLANNGIPTASSSENVTLGHISEMVLMLPSSSVQHCHLETLRRAWVAGLAAGRHSGSADEIQSLVLNRIGLLELTQHPIHQKSLLEKLQGEHAYFTLLRTALTSRHAGGVVGDRLERSRFTLHKDTISAITGLLIDRSDEMRRAPSTTSRSTNDIPWVQGSPFILSDSVLTKISDSGGNINMVDITRTSLRERLDAIRNIEKLTPLSRIEGASSGGQTTTFQHESHTSQLSLDVAEEEQRFGHDYTTEELSRERVQHWLKNALQAATATASNGRSSLSSSRQSLDKLLKDSQEEATRGVVRGEQGDTTEHTSAGLLCWSSWLWDSKCVMMFVSACYCLTHPAGIVAMAHALSQLTMLGYPPPRWATCVSPNATDGGNIDSVSTSPSHSYASSFRGLQMLDCYTRGHLPLDSAFIAGLLGVCIATQVQILSTNIYHKPLFIVDGGSDTSTPPPSHGAHLGTLVSSIETLHDLLQSPTPSNPGDSDVFPWLSTGSQAPDNAIGALSLETRMSLIESRLSRLVTVSSTNHALSKHAPPASRGLFAVATLFVANRAPGDHPKWLTERTVALEMLNSIHTSTTRLSESSPGTATPSATSLSQFTEVAQLIASSDKRERQSTVTTTDPSKPTNVVERLSNLFQSIVSGLQIETRTAAAITRQALKEFGGFLRGELHPYVLSTIILDDNPHTTVVTSEAQSSSSLRTLFFKAISSLLKNGKRAMELTNNVPIFTMHNVSVADIEVFVKGLILAKLGTPDHCAPQCSWIAKVFTAAGLDSGIATTPFVTSLTLSLLRVLMRQDSSLQKDEASRAAEGIYRSLESLMEKKTAFISTSTSHTNNKSSTITEVPLKHVVATLRIMAAGSADGDGSRPMAVLRLWKSCPSLQRETYLWKHSLREGVLPYLSVLRAGRDAITRESDRNIGLHMIVSAIRSYAWTVLQEGQERMVKEVANNKKGTDPTSSTPSPPSMSAPTFSDNAKQEMSRAIYSTVKDICRQIRITESSCSPLGGADEADALKTSPNDATTNAVVDKHRDNNDVVEMVGSWENMIADVGRLLAVLHKRRLIRTTTLRIYEHAVSSKQ